MPDQDDPQAAEPETPPAAAPEHATRGAGWSDEDDDWVHRDHGPRPDVPNHGARPFLIGVPILLITIAAIVAIVIAGGGDDDSGAAAPAGDGAARTTGSGSTTGITRALASHSAMLAGLADPGLLAQATCKAAGDDLYDCTYGAGAKGGRTLRIEWKDDVVSKRLEGDTATRPPRSSDDVGPLLSADDKAVGETTEYACATSVGMNPDGSQTGGNSSGFLCVQTSADGKPAGEEAIQRFVAFAADGTVTHDFALGGG